MAISLSLFFPVYNEEANIGAVIEDASKAVKNITADYEIIIVNDGSTDGTKRIVEDAVRRDPHMRMLHHEVNKGYGAALRSGFAAAQKEYVFFSDADLQFDLHEIENLLRWIPSYQVVIGYRSPRQDSVIRLLSAKGWNILNQALFGLRVKDINCAFKIFKTELVKNLDLQSEGSMISAELLIRLADAGINVKEIPVTHLPRKAGSPTGAKLRVIHRAFKEMIAMRKRRSN